MATVELYATLTRDPELRFAASGKAWTTINLAENRKGKDGTETTTWWKAKVFGEQAELAAETLRKGQRVKLRGFLEVEERKGQDGEKRVDLVVKPFADGLTVEGARAPRQDAPAGGAADDPWATPNTSYSDRPPF